VHQGYDVGKKVSGIKRHTFVVNKGLNHTTHVATANVTDRTAGLEALMYNRYELKEAKNVLVHGGYNGANFSKKVHSLLGACGTVAKRHGLHKFILMPPRWVAEHSLAQLDKFRR